MSNPIELPSSDRGQSSQSLSDEPIFPAEDEANFIEFTVRIPKEDLSLNTVQRAIQTQFDDKGLNQFMVSVEQKVGIAPNADESSQSGFMITSDIDSTDEIGKHRANGNCLCYALYEAYDNQEILMPANDVREAITVRNLRRHIVTAQVNELRQLSANAHKEIENLIQNVQSAINRILDPNIRTAPKFYNQKFDRETFFRNLNGSEENIQAAVDYIKKWNISSRNNISNEHLSEILTCLGMPRDSQFIVEFLRSDLEIIELKPLSIVGSPTDEDLLIALCDGLIGIASDICFEKQQNLNCDTLLNSVQRIFEENPGKGNVAMLQLICAKYNNSTASREDHIILQNGFPVSWIKHLVEFAIEIVKTNRPYYYIHNDYLPCVVQMLQRPILLIYENCERQNERMVNGSERGKVCNCMLSTLDGQSYEYSVNEEGRLLGTRPFSEVFTENMITIAMHPGHYYGIPSFTENKLHIGNRSVTGVNGDGLVLQESYEEPQDISSSSDSGLPEVDVDSVADIADTLQLFEDQDTEIFNKLRTQLTRFQDRFIPYLQSASKNWQAVAEVENLRHIQSCAEEMLKEDGLNFKPEFVAKIVCERLRMAMFGLGQLDSVEMGSINIGDISDEGENKYQPSCMWDFGQNRTVIPLQNNDFDYMNDGILGSPNRKGRKKKVNSFSVLRGDSEKNGYYSMKGQMTPSLQIRFQQYLRFVSGDSSLGSVSDGTINDFLSRLEINERNKAVFNEVLKQFSSFINDDWQGLNKETSLNKLPPALMISIGIQFGQIRQGTWNPFAVAAKKYLALQSGNGKFDRFIWKGGVPEEKRDPEDIASCAFGDLLRYIWPGRSSEHLKIIKQFEEGLCAYYAMTQEVLSRTDFPGNNRKDCSIDSIFRLEDAEAVETMGIVVKRENTYSLGISDLSAAKRPVFASTSAAAHLASLDHPNDFPPPIKIITKYSSVHHARIFGCHLFNVDSGGAARPLGDLLRKSRERSGAGVGTYTAGCPFFNDYQRECLTMLNGLNLEVVGVLAAAIDRGETYVLAGNNWQGSLSAKYTEIGVEKFQTKKVSDEERNPNWKKIKGQIRFCLENDSSGVGDIASAYSKAARQDDPNLEKLHNIVRSVVSGFEFTQILKLEGKKKKTNNLSKRKQ